MPIRPEMRDRYAKYWPVLSGFIRRARALAQCEWCGAVNGITHPVTGSKVVLTVAHVHDHRPENDRLDNLAALCQRCHNRHDAPLRKANRMRNGDLFVEALT